MAGAVNIVTWRPWGNHDNYSNPIGIADTEGTPVQFGGQGSRTSSGTVFHHLALGGDVSNRILDKGGNAISGIEGPGLSFIIQTFNEPEVFRSEHPRCAMAVQRLSRDLGPAARFGGIPRSVVACSVFASPSIASFKTVVIVVLNRLGLEIAIDEFAI